MVCSGPQTSSIGFSLLVCTVPTDADILVPVFPFADRPVALEGPRQGLDFERSAGLVAGTRAMEKSLWTVQGLVD